MRAVGRITAGHIIRRPMTTMRSSSRVPGVLSATLAAALAAATLAACGGEEQAAGPTVTVDAAEPVEVVADEYLFDPSSVVVEGGGAPVELVLDNQGSIAHNLRLFDGADEVGGTATFAGGDQRSASVELAPGAYRMVCTVADHEELGMVGELEVR